MKVMNAFAQVFAIFAFLTLGSLLILVSLHFLPLEDAVARLRDVYQNPWKSMQTGFVGLLFIGMGLIFAKMLLKKGRDTEAIILQSEIGPIVVSVTAMEDIARKVLKRFHIIKESKIKTSIRGKDVQMKMRLVLWSGANMGELLAEIQDETSARLRKLLTGGNKVEVICDVQRIEDYESQVHGADEQSNSIANR